MNRSELEKKLIEEDLRSDSYSLYGEDSDESYILKKENNDTWTMHYSERGLETGKSYFRTESEACETFLNILLSDPTMKNQAREQNQAG